MYIAQAVTTSNALQLAFNQKLEVIFVLCDITGAADYVVQTPTLLIGIIPDGDTATTRTIDGTFRANDVALTMRYITIGKPIVPPTVP